MRSRLAIVVVVALSVLLVGAVGVFAYDRITEDRIAQGIAVGGIELGGLDAAEARGRLRAELVEPLARPVVVRAGDRRFRLTARTARVTANVEASVAEALARSREGNPLSRTVRGVTGGRVEADIEPRVRFSRRAVSRLVARVARATNREARDARVAFSASGLQKVSSRTGVEIDRRELRDRVEAALVEPVADNRRVRASLEKTRPELTTGELSERYGTVVVVDRAGFRLRLFKDLEEVKSYPIAVGQVGLETPAGLYSVQNKAVDPAWNVPDSDWAGELAGQVIPGGAPNNPLKARWLGIYNGVGIHGTDARGSIGTNASHGCIRMLVEDVTDLYGRVPVGAQVYIA